MEPSGFMEWLPVIFAGLLGVAILAYVILDGYDLGIGMLFALAGDAEKDRMIAAIGPFWDANETWLVMAVGILLVAFPIAHGIILTALYLPVAIMLLGLILRGVAFEFRAKVRPERKRTWNLSFLIGSTMTAMAQGYMLGLYIMGLERTPETVGFALLTALCLAGAYILVGASWLIIKTDGELQRKAVTWAQRTLWPAAVGMVAVSLATPLVSDRIFSKWFEFPMIVLLAPLPLMAAALFVGLFIALRSLPDREDRWGWLPFAGTVGIFGLGFIGLAYSFYPYVVPDRVTIHEAASAPESLIIVLVGVVLVVPVIIGYSIFAYRVFGGKATDLRYD